MNKEEIFNKIKDKIRKNKEIRMKRKTKCEKGGCVKGFINNNICKGCPGDRGTTAIADKIKTAAGNDIPE